MKKFLALLLALAMVLSLAACGGSDAPAAEAPKAGALDIMAGNVQLAAIYPKSALDADGEAGITEGISLEQYEALTNDPSLTLYTKTGGTLNLFFNTTKGIMAKEEMRDAIMACLNCDDIMMASYIILAAFWL